jgi:chemotaxis protein MotB
MMRLRTILVVSVLVIPFVGCANSNETRDLEVKLQQVERERDTAVQRLAAEEARAIALQKRMETEQSRWTAARAEATSLNARLKQLQGDYDELKEVFERMHTQRLTRPDVSISPLPESIDEALLAFAERYPERVWYDRPRAALSFANDRLFELGSDQVKPDAQIALEELAPILALTAADEYEILVVGHTDDVPITKPETATKHPTNWHLSVHRAIAVQRVLAGAGLPPSRFGVIGYGPYRPIGDDRAQNRRVEIFVAPKGAVQPLAPVVP